MIVGRIRKWGNSVGLLIQKEDARKLGLHENEEVAVSIVKKSNVLRELFGSAHYTKPTAQILKEIRANESKYM